jgi:hypothetical protein
MFHQLNLRVTDLAPTTIGGITRPRSLLQLWVDTIVNEFNVLTNWPLKSIHQDGLFQLFNDRMARDQCNSKVRALLETVNNVQSIIGFEVTASGNSCPVSLPVTLPNGTVAALDGSTTEQEGNDPLTLWVTLSGSSKKFTLTNPIPLMSI